MTIWLDAQLSPAIADWVSSEFGIECIALRDLGLRDAEDREIFELARAKDVTVMTKDRDFVALVDRFGSPPRLILLTCGNTSNARLTEILEYALRDAVALLESGESLVEISSRT